MLSSHPLPVFHLAQQCSQKWRELTIPQPQCEQSSLLFCWSQGALVCWLGTSWGEPFCLTARDAPCPGLELSMLGHCLGRSVSGLSKENLIFLERHEDLKLTFVASKTLSRLSTAKKITSFIYHWPVPSSLSSLNVTSTQGCTI